MEEMLLLAALGLFGLGFGSFAGATVWRLRARQLLADKKAGEEVDGRELKTLKPLVKNMIEDRSQCLHCGHILAWYDLIPLFSWLSTAGRCRYCRKPIGSFEPLIELGTATLFVLVGLYASQLGLEGQWVPLVAWLVGVVMLVILFAYDVKWFLLPDVVTFPLIGLAAVLAAVRVFGASDPQASLLSLLGAVLILSGLYAALYFFSRWRYGEAGTWVGFGDVKLGLALALLVGTWELALLTLFLANLIGTLLVLPGLTMKKLTPKTHVPFGPLLIAGFFIALFWGNELIRWYLDMLMV